MLRVGSNCLCATQRRVLFCLFVMNRIQKKKEEKNLLRFCYVATSVSIDILPLIFDSAFYVSHPFSVIILSHLCEKEIVFILKKKKS